VHVLDAQHLLPFDPDILFLAACEHETFAASKIQTAARAGVVPNGFALDIVADREALTRAEALFRRVLSAAPDAIEARLRLGHVLLRLGRYDDAAAELRKAVPLLDADAQLQYEGALFLGAAEERLGRYDASRLAFERAASLYPAAQSPWLALSELAWPAPRSRRSCQRAPADVRAAGRFGTPSRSVVELPDRAGAQRQSVARTICDGHSAIASRRDGQVEVVGRSLRVRVRRG
jgi:tetratricopeptide (TPR) repeat protein